MYAWRTAGTLGASLDIQPEVNAMLLTEATAPAGTDAELAEIVRKTLDRSDQPLTLSQLRVQLTGPFRRKPEELRSVVGALVAQGAVFELPKYGRNHRYWTRDLDTYARQVLIEALSAKPLTRAELNAKVKTRFRDVPESRRGELFQNLLRNAVIHKLPRFVGANADRFSAATADPMQYVEDALRKVCKTLAAVGISEDDVYAAARTLVGPAAPQLAPHAAREQTNDAPPLPGDQARPNLHELLLERMLEIEPAARQGAMVYIPELRRSLDFQPAGSAEFENVVWSLVRQGRVALHKHGHPAGLSPDERSALIRDERGNHYHGISLRTS